MSVKSVLACCVFWPAFGCCVHLKASRNTFFEPFSIFFVPLYTFFSNFTSEIKKKRLKRNKLKTAKKSISSFNQFLGVCSTWKLVEIHNTWVLLLDFVDLQKKNVKLQLIWHSLPSNQDWLGIMLRKQLVKHIFDTKSSQFLDFAFSLINKMFDYIIAEFN